MNKKIVIALVVAAFAGGVFFLIGNNIQKEEPSSQEKGIIQKVHKHEKRAKSDKKTEKTSVRKDAADKESAETKNLKHARLYDSASIIPLSAVTEMAELPQDVQAKINSYVDNSVGIFMLKHNKDKVIMITENPDNIRHGIDFVEISVPTGHQTVSTFGYNGKIQDSENDKWEYNENQLPVKHTKYNKDGDVEYTEIWNYDSSEPVKYEMKNSEGKTLSIRKETVTDGSNLRVEHLTYDTKGNTKTNISATYEGADIKRFTYYNADKPSEGVSIFSEYENGNKIKETVYTSELKVQNVYEAAYKDGERENIKVFDSDNSEVETVEPLPEN